MAYAEVALMAPDSTTLVDGTLTDSLGYFTLRAEQKGTYLLVVRLPGFAAHIDTVRVEREVVVLPDIVLRQGQQQLTPTVIEIERLWSNWQAGKQEYSPASSPVLEGATLQELLEEIPGVEVTIEGQVLYRGMPATLYLNGKPSVLLEQGGNVLKSFNVKQIERVEILSVPTAKQDAESSGAIVNVILKNKPDYADLLSFSATVSYPAMHSVGGMFSAPALGGWWTIGLSAQREWSPMSVTSERHYLAPSAPYEYLRTSSREEEIHQAVLPSLMANYTFQKGWSAQVTAMSHLSRHTESGKAIYSLSQTKDDTTATRTTSREEKHVSHTADLTITKHWSKTLPATLQMSLSGEQEASTSTQHISETTYDTAWQVPAPYQQFTLESKHRQAIAQIDWKQILTPDTSWQLEAGSKLQYRELTASATLQTSPDNTTWQADTFPLAGHYSYREMVAALYGETSFKVGKWRINAGARAEYWQLSTEAPYLSEGQTFTHLQVFPSVSGEVPLSSATQLGVVYSRRIDRPSFWELAPLREIVDRTSLWAGNPALQPTDIHSVEVSLRVRPARSLMVTLTPFARYEDSPIERIRWLDTIQNAVIAQPLNLVGAVLTGIELYLYWKPSARFKTTFQTTWHYGYLDGTNFDPQMKERQYGGRFLLTQEVSLARNITSQLQIRGMLPTRHGNHTHTNVPFLVRVGVRTQWLDRKLTATLNIINPLNSMYFDVETEEEDFHMDIRFSRWVPRVSLTVSYNFDTRKGPLSHQHEEGGEGM